MVEFQKDDGSLHLHNIASSQAITGDYEGARADCQDQQRGQVKEAIALADKLPTPHARAHALRGFSL